jgi:hypothetical protein
MLIPTDLQVGGNFSAAGMSLPPGAVTNASVAANAAIASSKLVCQKTITQQLIPETSPVTALTIDLASLVGAAGTLKDFNAWVTTVATGADRTVTVDLQKSSGGGSYASICTTTIGFTNTSAALTLVAAVPTSFGLLAGDLLRAVVTVAGSAGAQALGLSVTLRYDETYN